MQIVIPIIAGLFSIIIIALFSVLPIYSIIICAFVMALSFLLCYVVNSVYLKSGGIRVMFGLLYVLAGAVIGCVLQLIFPNPPWAGTIPLFIIGGILLLILYFFGCSTYAYLKNPDDGYVAIFVMPHFYYTVKRSALFQSKNREIDTDYGVPACCNRKKIIQFQHMSRLHKKLKDGAWYITETNDTVAELMSIQSDISVKVLYRDKDSKGVLSFMEQRLYKRLFHNCSVACPKISTCTTCPFKQKQAVVILFRIKQHTQDT